VPFVNVKQVHDPAAEDDSTPKDLNCDDIVTRCECARINETGALLLHRLAIDK
jgi:hypothetical protein